MAFVRKTIKVLSENITREDLGTALIADRLAMTPRSFYRRFRSISRITPGALIKFYRLEMASRLQANPGRSCRSGHFQPLLLLQGVHRALRDDARRLESSAWRQC